MLPVPSPLVQGVGRKIDRAVIRQQVKRHQGSGRFLRQLFDPALGGMNALQKCIEIERPLRVTMSSPSSTNFLAAEQRGQP